MTRYRDLLLLGHDLAVTGDAITITGDQIEWAGAFTDLDTSSGRAVSLQGAFVTPAFIDAHAHLTPTGLTAAGVDLHDTSGLRDLVKRLGTHVRATKDRFVWGNGWDDTHWESPPTADAIERVSQGRHVYLSRVDAHSALASHATLRAAGCATFDGCEIDERGVATGIIRRAAHHAVRLFFLSRLPRTQIRAAHRRAASMAVAAGITSVHEMGGPLHAAGERDLDLLLEDQLPISVVPYYASDDLSVATSRGLKTLGGDWNVDGSLGSRTAALLKPYADRRGHHGFLYRDAESLASFFTHATKAGLQAGVHCIGDAACEAAVEGLERAARRCGARAVRARRHRLEHFEMASPDLIARAARVGAAFSLQPAFDKHWGGSGGMYRTRLGVVRARSMNDFARIFATGAVIGFGSDSPVTTFDPLSAIAAAVRPHERSHGISRQSAFAAATLGAAGLAHQERTTGRIAPGYRADLCVWDDDPRTVQHPRLRATISRGRVVWGRLQ